MTSELRALAEQVKSAGGTSAAATTSEMPWLEKIKRIGLVLEHRREHDRIWRVAPFWTVSFEWQVLHRQGKGAILLEFKDGDALLDPGAIGRELLPQKTVSGADWFPERELKKIDLQPDIWALIDKNNILATCVVIVLVYLRDPKTRRVMPPLSFGQVVRHRPADEWDLQSTLRTWMYSTCPVCAEQGKYAESEFGLQFLHDIQVGRVAPSVPALSFSSSSSSSHKKAGEGKQTKAVASTAATPAVQQQQQQQQPAYRILPLRDCVPCHQCHSVYYCGTTHALEHEKRHACKPVSKGLSPIASRLPEWVAKIKTNTRAQVRFIEEFKASDLRLIERLDPAKIADRMQQLALNGRQPKAPPVGSKTSSPSSSSSSTKERDATGMDPGMAKLKADAAARQRQDELNVINDDKLASMAEARMAAGSRATPMDVSSDEDSKTRPCVRCKREVATAAAADSACLACQATICSPPCGDAQCCSKCLATLLCSPKCLANHIASHSRSAPTIAVRQVHVV
jgi:hypothetical protein